MAHKRTAVGGRRLGKLTEIPVPPVTDHLAGVHRAYEAAGGISIIVAQEPNRRAPAGIWLPESARMLWHLSISHPKRYPTWDEIADARYELIPNDLTMALLLPPPDRYLNVHEFCFHLWQIDDRRVQQ